MPEGKSHAEDDVLQGRATIFSLLLARLRFLHSNRTVPSSHYVGKDYVEDKRRVKCIISATFLFPGEVDPFHFWLHQTKVDGVQYGNALVVTALREISAQLWEDLRLKDDGQAFIIGYLTSLMPAVNRRLINNRYNKGHLLSRTFAIFEAVDVSITVAGRRLWLSWPPSLPSFPPTTELAGIQTPLYVRDYIDSISAYYRYEYDDAIRRVITATENFLDNHGWKVSAGGSGGVLHWIMSIFRRKPQGSSFRRRLRDNLDLSKISNEVVHDNLQFVYSIRNRIVHNGFRMMAAGQHKLSRRALLAGACAVPAIGAGANLPGDPGLRRDDDLRREAWANASACLARAEAEIDALAHSPDEDAYDLAVDQQIAALSQVLEAAAPDLAAVGAKIALIARHSAWELGCGEAALAVLGEDVRRLGG
jgi:hypothetical protein